MASRIALIGLGAAAQRIHLPAYARLAGARVVAACDPVVDGTKLPFAVYRDLPSLLSATTVDVAVVATPTSHHYALARELIGHGIHVLCEKPFTERVDEAVELVKLARAHGVRIAVNNEFRFMRCYQAACALIGQPGFGSLQFVEMRQTFHADATTEAGWRAQDPERTCKEFGTHVFDLSRFFFGADPLRLRARMPRPGTTGGPDMLNLIDLEFPGDRWARITLNRVTKGDHRYLDVRLEGTAACVQTTFGGQLELAAGINARSRRPFLRTNLALGGSAYLLTGERQRRLATEPANPFADATRALMQDFLDAIAHDRDCACSGSDNLRSFALMRAAYESAAADRDVDLSFLGALP